MLTPPVDQPNTIAPPEAAPHAAPRPFIVAVGSQKGGVSKTTTTLSLGACLAEGNGLPGRNVLLLDLDPQANLTMALGVDPAEVRRMVGDALLDQTSLLAVSRASPVPILDLVPANQGLLVLDKALFGRPGYEYRLRQQLHSASAAHYDIALIDCPPAFGTLTMNALTAADLLLIPVTAEYFAARSLQQFLELVELVVRKTNPRLRYRIVITLFDRRNRISHVIHEQLRAKFQGAVLNTMISIDTRLRESPVLGQPITRYAPRSRGAAEYHALAAEVWQIVTELRQDDQTRS